ncbi:dual specificity protein phosphatase family protein [Alteromonas sp. ALT199]|uniref:diacylglycerol kinase family protein n=1 Tax=unclassified Alteromonas TaxID=2614992 RepID=UPI001BEA4498|nr:diacylglycerol kinase family protein [Alteromonas sp. ALT199]MBT3136445.1 dual specificity protein phosphatase family protein [Alteromonas sp. ALT199]
MKMVKYYILGALLALLLTVTVPVLLLKIAFGWIAFSLIAVSSAYLLNYPSLFRKREDGSIPFYVRWIFVPFLLGSGLYNEYARRTDKVPPLQKIEPHLFLACRMSTQHVDLLNENNVDAILDVTAEFDGLDWTAYQEDYKYLNVPVLDHTSPTSEQLVLAINWLNQQISDNKNVVVHCALGRGRSVLVVAAYLLAKNPNLSVDDALRQINQIRQTARLNKHQLASLQKVRDGGLLSLRKELTLIVNPVAGGGKWKQYRGEVLSRLNEKFKVTVKETTPEVDGKALAQQAKDEKADIVIACGGDGTLTEVASALINTDITMGIIPFGTANALSQVLHGYISKVMPISTACDIIIKGDTLKIDTATCNDKVMLLVAAVGFEEQMISAADREEKNVGGQFAYLKGLWNAISNNENTTFEVAKDDKPTETLETPSFVIANAAPMTTALAQGAEQPDITDGKLDLTWLLPQPSSDRQFASLAELVLSPAESKKQSESIRHERASRITLSFDKPTAYAVDGEIYEGDKIIIKTVPRSLTVLANLEDKD